MPTFCHSDLELIEPTFRSELTDLVLDLEHLRRKTLSESTHPSIFFQLKQIFHMLESIGSARIEGNNTTIAEFIETKIDSNSYIDEGIQEIRNIEQAMDFVDDNVGDFGITHMFLRELHKIIVKDLGVPPRGEGDPTPGQYRENAVQITGAKHVPPETGQQVKSYMDELLKFIDRSDAPKYDLLKVALAHHRFMWIHPFSNGNGRTGRLFTYAMLVKQGFNVNMGRILNPTAVFCIDRENYNKLLALADENTAEGKEEWCIYVLKGLKDEIDKIDKLSDYSYLKDKILIPSLRYAREMEYINSTDYRVLECAAENQIIQNKDIKKFFPGKVTSAISREIRILKDKKVLVSETSNSRTYHLNFANNFLMRGIIKVLQEENFIPLHDDA
jgi:Fic family protein